MRLQFPFYRFPFRFDVERLRAEALAFPEERWCKHPGNYKGNSFLPLISTDGGDDDRFDPPMCPTQNLLGSPYLMQVLGQFKTLHGRARLMRLEPGDGVPPHNDLQYYWRMHTRVHIPIVTHPNVRFFCDTESVHMAEGEAWTFDNWRTHKVDNATPVRRIHLTFDTIGSNAFWAMARPHHLPGETQFIAYDAEARPNLSFESYAGDLVMPPAEMEIEMTRIAADVAALASNNRDAILSLQRRLGAFCNEWRLAWHEAGPVPENLPRFTALRVRLSDECRLSVPRDLRMASNGVGAQAVIHSVLGAATRESPEIARRRASAATASKVTFDRPIFIVCAPRSGSTLLFETLARSNTFWTLGGEGHGQVEIIPELRPAARDFDSNRLIAADATPAVAAQLHANYTKHLRDAGGVLHSATADAPRSVRFLEKTPKNALRIPFFKALYPDAKFIFLHREPRANISAIMEAWRSGSFVTYRHLEGWKGPPWSMLLIPGWRELSGRELTEIAMRQWCGTNETILNDLAEMPDADWCSLSYEEFLALPEETLKRICAFADIPFDDELKKVTREPLRPSRYTLTKPDAEKWRKNEAALNQVLGQASAVIARLAMRPNRESA